MIDQVSSLQQRGVPGKVCLAGVGVGGSRYSYSTIMYAAHGDESARF